MDEKVNIPADLAQRTQTLLDALWDKLSGVKALVIASVDGFAVASRASLDIDANKVAAMASSFSALGVVVAEESHMGAKKTVTLEVANGYVILLDIARSDYPMVLSITAGEDAILAQVLYLARESISKMAIV